MNRSPYRALVRLSPLCAAVIPLALACDFDDPEPTKANKPGVAAAPIAQGTANPSPTALPGVNSSSSPTSAACPQGMLEVNGLYCEDVMHWCLKGARNHLGEDVEEPEPYYCDQYQVGFAKCFGKQEPKHFCIDQYEYPNQIGAIPMVMVSWYESRRLCEIQGKRLCRDDEWTLACEGPQRLPYPYGWARDKNICNIDLLWIAPNDDLLSRKNAPPAEINAEIDRLSKRVPSGARPLCKSPYGVMDMSGNVDEWAVNVTHNGKPYMSVFKGGHWVSGARNRCRPVTLSHDETTAYYAEGFRCCANVPAPSSASSRSASDADAGATQQPER